MEHFAFRLEATHHLSKAQELLTNAEPESLRYACLELRMCIEALAYDVFRRYSTEISASGLNAWMPKQVMRELKYIDPDVEEDRDISIIVPASEGRPEKTYNLGHEHRMSSRWADQAHNILGSYLHQPTLKPRKSSKFISHLERAKVQAIDIALELERVLASPIAGFRAHRLFQFNCNCESPIARDVDFLKAGKEVACSNCGCQLSY